jgi:predicted  nucleic acid-binding Zn-ribbon protein
MRQAMRKIMDCLLALQKLQFEVRARTPASSAGLENLRAEVPPPILAHYERLVARGKKGVALAQNGVCSECHLRITGGKLVGLSAGIDLQLCDNCGRYLYLPEAVPGGLGDGSNPPPPAVQSASRKAAQHVA